MSIFDSILGEATGNNASVQGLAAKVGLPPEQVEQAMAALGQAHDQEGDTVQTASESSGIPADKLSQIVQHLGGEEALGRFSALLPSGAGDGSSVLGGLKSFL